MSSKRPDRMPVLVVSGFLGAGKTTFLNRLLDTPALADSLVIVNEFGDAALDGLFLQEEADAKGTGLMIEELTSGCLCCTLQGPLVTTLEDLLRARDNGRIKPFKQLIIETTGLADPAPILGAFARHPYLALRYLVGGIVTVVDAAQDPKRLDETSEASAQIAVADVLAISKTDLASQDETGKLENALRKRNPHARLATTNNLIDDSSWLETLLEQASVIEIDESQPDSDHSHSHSHDHDHDHGHQHAYSVVVETDAPLDERVITMFMDLLGMNMPGDLLRVKGIAWITGAGGTMPWAVHAAGPLQHPPRPISETMAEKLVTNATQIVVITHTDQTSRVEELFAACLRQNRANPV